MPPYLSDQLLPGLRLTLQRIRPDYYNRIVTNVPSLGGDCLHIKCWQSPSWSSLLSDHDVWYYLQSDGGLLLVLKWRKWGSRRQSWAELDKSCYKCSCKIMSDQRIFCCLNRLLSSLQPKLHFGWKKTLCLAIFTSNNDTNLYELSSDILTARQNLYCAARSYTTYLSQYQQCASHGDVCKALIVLQFL